MQGTSFDPGWKSGENTLLLSPAGHEKEHRPGDLSRGGEYD
jgi:hypothetical protein